jgi:hypothetical protein
MNARTLRGRRSRMDVCSAGGVIRLDARTSPPSSGPVQSSTPNRRAPRWLRWLASR